ncbi:MAG: transketolase, partial [Deltaproteobacteria bacterium]|nr:transketolase [Deltaproteobacteria bacterium]
MTKDLDPTLVEKAVNCIRMLAVDTVQKANSGHPGAPMGLANIAFELWTSHLRYDPQDPGWLNRDRFVLSCGHASSLLYSMLHLSGYDLSLDDLKNFRQLGSKTPGHPEVHVTPGVEMTTGPLGQGISSAVGMALGLKMLAARFADKDAQLVTARVFGICSDGDIQEGISAEACGLAGHFGLDNLIFFYDDNKITIDGPTSMSFTEDVGARFEAQGWFVQHVDGHDHGQIRVALDAAVAESSRPSFIVARTHIAMGSPNKQDSEKSHGSPLGLDEVKATKENLGWPLEPTFLVPDDVRAIFADRAEEGAMRRRAWLDRVGAFKQGGSAAAELWEQLTERRVPADLLDQLVASAPKEEAATRVLSGTVQQRVAQLVPSLVGGSADLTPSTKTFIKDSAVVQRGAFEGRNFHFGVREHGMGAIAHGLALGEGFIPYTATFMVFSDYMRPTIRLAALSRQRCVFVFTHDSVYVGEDGPTHQPVEHYWALRAIPNVDLCRPADALECAAVWTHALERQDGPTVLSLTRQKLPVLPRPAGFEPATMLKGAYVVADAAGGKPFAVVLATGSEVGLVLEAKALLGPIGDKLRVVSAPCLDAFQRQPESYRDEVLPPGVPRCSVELG